ncbi:oligoribonuclease [Lysinibacter cavernae]|uniref:Oligoribonuclease n=1 Tax=Lysinibacter cavernae TaxID=1640652 RepID=A0A7X5QYZ9_9MICO|nr:oligoribonuclease [Lysinibacter cavernae]NIH52467.1 oligoribonuclease [Lysinibacter cavernae]
MSTPAERLVWIDCEMTGLDPSIDELVEIAVVITDFDLNILDPGFEVVIKPSEAAFNNMGEFVINMHTESGLITELDGGLTVAEAERQVIEYIDRFVPKGKRALLAGNTIGTDRMFLATYMPTLDEHLHYRNIDVSSIKELARRWFPPTYYNAPEKTGGHRALADILESIRELAYYRSAVFIQGSGPGNAESQEIAKTVVDNFAEKM